MLWVDYGDTGRLAAARFRPMTEEFAAEPLFAVRACCAGVGTRRLYALCWCRYPLSVRAVLV